MSGGNIHYFLCYRVDVNIIGADGGRPMIKEGKQKCSDPTDLGLAKDVAEWMNDSYGDGTHWVEDETGEKVWPEDELSN